MYTQNPSEKNSPKGAKNLMYGGGDLPEGMKMRERSTIMCMGCQIHIFAREEILCPPKLRGKIPCPLKLWGKTIPTVNLVPPSGTLLLNTPYDILNINLQKI